MQYGNQAPLASDLDAVQQQHHQQHQHQQQQREQQKQQQPVLPQQHQWRRVAQVQSATASDAGGNAAARRGSSSPSRGGSLVRRPNSNNNNNNNNNLVRRPVSPSRGWSLVRRHVVVQRTRSRAPETPQHQGIFVQATHQLPVATVVASTPAAPIGRHLGPAIAVTNNSNNNSNSNNNTNTSNNNNTNYNNNTNNNNFSQQPLWRPEAGAMRQKPDSRSRSLSQNRYTVVAPPLQQQQQRQLWKQPTNAPPPSVNPASLASTTLFALGSQTPSFAEK
ncbi:unnamed protein product, partial [Polarella glacialis]